MRTLLWMVSGGSSTPGGHVTQWHKTTEALRTLGVDASEFEGEVPALDSVDVVHGFGLRSDHIRVARRRGIPVVLSTIYWSREYRAHGPDVGAVRTLARRSRMAALLTARSLQGRHHDVARGLLELVDQEALAFESADLLLPNSQLEAAALRSELGVSTPSHVVPNAVDPEIFHLPDALVARSGLVCAGRVEPHKNQLGLIRATNGMDLTIVGPAHPDHPGYAIKCKDVAGPRVRFVDALEPSQLADLFRTSAVHVLPSFFETTGLVNLEAALCGAAIVSTDRGYASEYFGHEAAYCDPSSSGSIRAAVDRAYRKGSSMPLRDVIADRFSWSEAAIQTLAAYKMVTSNTIKHSTSRS